MNITLHSAVEQVRDLLDQIDPETGELPAEYEQARAVVATKATAVAAYILETERQADNAEAYLKEVAQRVRAAKKRADWLRTYLAEHMAAAGVLKITDERGIFSAVLSKGRDKAVDVFDETQLPDDYMTEVPASYVPNKKAIRSAMDDGYNVPGARLVARDRLTIK
jgi:hypothetical protein